MKCGTFSVGRDHEHGGVRASPLLASHTGQVLPTSQGSEIQTLCRVQATNQHLSFCPFSRTSKTPGSSLPAASSKGHWEVPHQTPGHVAASRQADQIPEIREHPVTRARRGGAAPQTVSLSLRTAVSPNPGDPGTDAAGSCRALRGLWARALPRAEDRCVKQEKNWVGFHLDEEIPDRLCHWEWQKAPFLGPRGGTRAELGVVGGRQGGRQRSPDPTSRLWLESFLSGVILSLLGHLAAELPRARPPPPCSVKLST